MVLFFASITGACTPVSNLQTTYQTGFYYFTLAPQVELIFADQPEASQKKHIPLAPPTDCTLYSIRPAPTGPWIAIEWECISGPSVELLNTSNGLSHFALSDPGIDNRFLAWQKDGLSLYLKIGTLSVPQTLRVNVSNGKAIELPISAYTYDLTVSPDGQKIVYSLNKGIGFGSETWILPSAGQKSVKLLTDNINITALAQYSPDGKTIAYIKIPDNQSISPTGELWLMDADGLNQRKVADADAGHGFAPAWSPDGLKIVFVGREKTEDPESLNVSIITLANGTITTVPQAPATQPEWSPLGETITFSGPKDAGNDKMVIWIYDIHKNQLNLWLENACCAGWIK